MASAAHSFATSMMRSPRRYDSAGRGPPMRYASSASSTCSARASIDEWIATVRIASRRHVRITRQAISPRLAMRIFENKDRVRCRSERSRFRAGGVHRPELPVADVDGGGSEEDRASRRDRRIGGVLIRGRRRLRDEARQLYEPRVGGRAALKLESGE